MRSHTSFNFHWWGIIQQFYNPCKRVLTVLFPFQSAWCNGMKWPEWPDFSRYFIYEEKMSDVKDSLHSEQQWNSTHYFSRARLCGPQLLETMGLYVQDLFSMSVQRTGTTLDRDYVLQLLWKTKISVNDMLFRTKAACSCDSRACVLEIVIPSDRSGTTDVPISKYFLCNTQVIEMVYSRFVI